MTMTAEERSAAGGLVKHILVPLDGSELALQAMPTAHALARRFGADLQTVSVGGTDEESERLRAQAAAAAGVESGDRRVFAVAHDDPADVILTRARELGACVVCLATKGRGRVHGAVIGSVARSLLQRSREPVVALGPAADNPGSSVRPIGWPEPLSVPRIVACVDGSESSEQVLPVAAVWARALRMSMTILTVTDDALPPISEGSRRSRYGQHEDADGYVAGLVREWARVLPDVDGIIVADPGGPAGGVRTHLAQRPAGLLALTTHARSGLQRALVGATAASIVHASVAPCLVAPVRG